MFHFSIGEMKIKNKRENVDETKKVSRNSVTPRTNMQAIRNSLRLGGGMCDS